MGERAEKSDVPSNGWEQKLKEGGFLYEHKSGNIGIEISERTDGYFEVIIKKPNRIENTGSLTLVELERYASEINLSLPPTYKDIWGFSAKFRENKLKQFAKENDLGLSDKNIKDLTRG